MVRKIFLAVLAFLIVVPILFAGDTCVPVRGLAQQELFNFNYILRWDPVTHMPLDPWAGPVQIVLGNNEVLTGIVSENDGTIADPQHGNAGQGRGGSMLFDFGHDGTFLVRNANAVWPGTPRFAGVNFGLMYFKAEGAIESGTGRFATAKGNITFDGPAVAWNADVFPPSGRFNNNISGNVCGVGPINIAPPRPNRVSPAVVPAAASGANGCKAFALFEYLDASRYSVKLNLGGAAAPFNEISNEAIYFGKQVGMVTFGTETLRFHFANGSTFDLVAQWETIGDPAVVSRVNGVGDITNGTGDFTGATGRLNYHGPFTSGPDGNFTFLDIAYRGQVCTTH